jgi:hypothetical protein
MKKWFNFRTFFNCYWEETTIRISENEVIENYD